MSYFTKQIFASQILRYPRLDTVVMIEEQIKKSKSDKTMREIWKSLPKKVMWQTFKTTVDYLVYSGKILIDKDNTVVWIWNPELMRKIMKQGVEV